MESEGEFDTSQETERIGGLDAAYSRRKTDEIESACRWMDIGKLGALAISTGGLLTDELRRKACTYFFALNGPKLTAIIQGQYCLDLVSDRIISRAMWKIYALASTRLPGAGKSSLHIETNTKFI